MSRAASIPLTFFAIGCITALGYSFVHRTTSASSEDPITAVAARAKSALLQHESAVAKPVQVVNVESTSVQEDHSKDVAKWIEAVSSEDESVHAAAINALAAAPKAQAVPVLANVLGSGSLDDRQLALGSLRQLARDQGDSDGSIRDVLRHEIYDNDVETVGSAARIMLDDIEQQLSH